MATTSFLYHALGLRGYNHLKTEYVAGEVFHHVERQRQKRYCRACHAESTFLIFFGSFVRAFLALPVGGKKQHIVLHGHEQYCCRCGKKQREPIPFTEGKRRHLRVFARYAIELCARMTLLDVADHLGVGWDMIKEILKGHLAKKLTKRRLTTVRFIAVDEFAIRKGHQYMTVVMDLETGAILYAAEGKGADSLIPFLRRLRRSRAPIKAVAVDMSRAYISAVNEVFGKKVKIVNDPYHIIAQANRALDATRRDLYRELDGPDRKIMKGSRFLLLWGLENLDEEKFEKLEAILEANQPLYQAYALKEELRMYWKQPGRRAARKFLKGWIREAEEAGLSHFVRLAKTLKEHEPYLLAYFDFPITTGPLEGTNNKIKVLKRNAYGYRDIDFFKLRLYFLHENKRVTPALSG